MSRELDAKVAEALGWHKTAQFRKPRFGLGYSYWVDNYGDVACLPAYKTDIAAAFPLFEWLAARGLVRLCNGDGDSKDCDFSSDGLFYPDLNCAHVTADTWAEVICLALLTAKGVECAT